MNLPTWQETTRDGVIWGARFRTPTLRAELGRFWDPKLPVIGFVGQNPGKASHECPDMTAAKYRGFAERWGFGGYLAWNLWEFVSTAPAGLWEALRVSSIVRDGCDDCLRSALAPGYGPHCGQIRTVCLAWGNPPPRGRGFGGSIEFRSWVDRTFAVRAALRKAGVRVVVAALTASGNPAHLSRLAYQPCREIEP